MTFYKWIGTQEFPGGSIELYDLLIDFPGHPKGSTVSEQTLRGLGAWRGHKAGVTSC